MVKKILSTIILIMIICSTCVYATELVAPEDTKDTNTSSQEQNSPSTGENTPSEDANNNPTFKPEEDTNVNDSSQNQGTDVKPDVDLGNNTNPDKEENNNDKPDDTEPDNSKPDNTNKPNNNKPNNNIDKDNNKNETTGTEIETGKKPTQNDNENITNNTIEPKSSEARLKELKINIEGLTPDFNKNITEYYLIVDLSVEKINVTAKAVDNKATVTISGNKRIKEGENTITITVRAEDDTIKKYYIYVTKIDNVELANAELESLEIDGVNIYPTFKSNIYNYNLNINKNLSNLNITAKPQRENAKVEIEGNENLEEGENIIKITVTAEDKTTIRTYKINTFIDLNKVEIQQENKLPAIILIIVLGTCIIALGIFMVVKNRR